MAQLFNHRQRHLLLGGGGFVGRHVAALLLNEDQDVILAGRSETSPLAGPYGWRQFDLCTADWDELIDGIDVVHHYAWSSVPASAIADPMLDLSTNVLPALGLLEAMRKKGCDAPRLLFASSGGTVYGPPVTIPVAESHQLKPITAYGVGKVTVELYMATYRSLYGLDCRVARLANPFGAEQDPAKGLGAVSTFLSHALARRPITIWGNGEIVRDFIHVSDAASALATIAAAPPITDCYTFNIGSGHGVSLKGVIDELEKSLGHKLDTHYEASRAFDVPVNVLDISLIRETLGWQPRLSFSEGVAKTVSDLIRRQVP